MNSQKKVYQIISLVAICIYICVLVGCGQSSALVGAWYPAEDDTAPSGYPDYMILEENGVLQAEGATGVWSEEDGILTIRATSNLGRSKVSSYNYSIDGSTLTLVDVEDDETDAVIYRK